MDDKLRKIREKKGQVVSALNISAKIIKKKSDKIDFLRSQLSKASGQAINFDLIYENFKENFSANVLAILRSIDHSSSSDSTFILTCVRFLYKNDLDRLKNISVTGRIRKNEQKEKMSPQKQDLIRAIFDERLDAVVSETKERLQRAKKLNHHIKRAIFNANSKQSELEKVNAAINSTQQTQ